MDLDHFATLRAELDAGKELGELLAHGGMGESAWRSIEVEWLTRIAVAAASEDFELTQRYNRAFEAARRRMGLSKEAVGPPPSAPEAAVDTSRPGSAPSEWAALSPFRLAAPGAQARPRPADAVPVLPFSGESSGPAESCEDSAPPPAVDPPLRPMDAPPRHAFEPQHLLVPQPTPELDRPHASPVQEPWYVPPPRLSEVSPYDDAPETQRSFAPLHDQVALPFKGARAAADKRPSRPPDAVPVLPFRRTTHSPALEQPLANLAMASATATLAMPIQRPPEDAIDHDDDGDTAPLERTLDEFQVLEGHVLPFVRSGVHDQESIRPLLTLEQFASLSAELTCAERGDTLRRYQLDEHCWLAERHAWEATLRGDANLRHQFEELLRVYVEYLRQRTP